MPDKYFWTHIKDKLHGYEVPFVEEDWCALSESLDGEFDTQLSFQLSQLQEPSYQDSDWDAFLAYSEEQAQPLPSITGIDSNIKNKFKNFELPLDPLAWDAFEAHSSTHITLRGQQAPSSYTEQQNIRPFEAWNFDAIIREKLTGLKYYPTYGDWLDMLERLEAGFDAEIQTKLYGFEIVDKKADWKRMSLLLDKISSPVRSIPWIRLSVAAAIFFAFMIGGNLWIQQHGLPSTFASWVNKEDVNPTQLAPSLASTHSQSQKQDQTQPQDNALAFAEEPDSSFDIGDVLLASKQEESVNSPAIEGLDASYAPPIELVKTVSLAEKEPLPGDKKNNQERRSAEEERARAVRKLQRTQINKMGVLAMSELGFIENNERSWLPVLGRKKRDIWIGLYTANARTKAELNGPKSNMGYSFGLRGMVSLNERWSLLTGLAYSKKNFLYSYRDGFTLDSSAIEGSLKNVDVPLMLRYEFASENEMKVYFQGGVVSTLSLVEDYLLYSSDNPINAESLSQDPLGNTPSDYQQKLNTYPGNIYLSFGLSAPIGEQLKVEFEPYFLQNLQLTGGVGSNGIRKRLYTAGVGVNFFWNPSKKEK